MNTSYSAFGMVLESELPLQLPLWTPEASQSQRSERARLTVRYGAIGNYPSTWHCINATEYGPVGEAVLVRVRKVADYLLENDTITIQPLEQCGELNIGRFLVGLVMGIFLMRKKALMLHGSAIIKEGRAIGLIGLQCSGKSTTAAKLATLGYAVLCDDVIPIMNVLDVQQQIRPMVLPGVPRPKLLPDAYGKLIGNPEHAPHLFDGVDKYQSLLSESHESAPLKALCLLVPDTKVQEVRMERIAGSRKVTLVMAHSSFLKGLEQHDQLFSRTLGMLGSVSLYRIERPSAGDSLDQVAALIQSID